MSVELHHKASPLRHCSRGHQTPRVDIGVDAEVVVSGFTVP
jgi:hypothetical protein